MTARLLVKTIAWIADHEAAPIVSVLVHRKSVKDAAAVHGLTPLEIAEQVVRHRGGKIYLNGPTSLKATMNFIERFASARGESPTYREIAEALAIPGGAGAAVRLVYKLAESGRIKLPVGKVTRGIRIVRQ